MRFLAVCLLMASICILPGWGQNASPAATDKDPGYIDPDESLFHRQPLPDSPISLIGGTVQDVDRLRNRLTVKVTGGGARTMSFDDRTRVLRDGEVVTYEKIRKGDRVYVDTVLYQQKVFARSIRIQTHMGEADARGQITAYDPASGRMTLVDELSSAPVAFKVDSQTKVTRKDGLARVSDLVPGSLVTVKFVPGREQEGMAREVAILAQPGANFVFAGTVTYVDLRLGKFSVANKADNKTYDLSFNPEQVENLSRLRLGSEVMVTAIFSGQGYRAQDIDIMTSQAEKQ
jgi:hypothetical protein